jgi:hypothetical protein
VQPDDVVDAVVTLLDPSRYGDISGSSRLDNPDMSPYRKVRAVT